MRWKPGGISRNIEDRRGQGGGMFGGGLGGGGMKLGLGGTVIVLLLGLFFGRDFTDQIGVTSDGSTITTPANGTLGGGAAGPVEETPEERELVEFVSFVLDDVQATWAKILPAEGTPYRDAKLVLYRNGTTSACGDAESSVGPFYCPVDEKVYIDLAFYEELKDRFGASGDFAQAYVIAHELGHHVQNLLGTEQRVHRLQQANPGEANELSVETELQADCYAGVWAHSTDQRKLLQQGDVQEALDAAAAVGDDRLQRATTGHVNPDTFTHGTSAQRMSWFQRGLTTGDPRACNTFGAQ